MYRRVLLVSIGKVRVSFRSWSCGVETEAIDGTQGIITQLHTIYTITVSIILSPLLRSHGAKTTFWLVTEATSYTSRVYDTAPRVCQAPSSCLTPSDNSLGVLHPCVLDFK